jgi:hypothetical protein
VSLAGITENAPVTGADVVRLAVAEPGWTAVIVIHAPDEPDASL